MTPEFWHERWQRGEIGWHIDEINVHLQQHWQRLDVAPHRQVLVPLCGKSRDLLWLAGQGHRVLGIEISPIALETFFAENRLVPSVGQEGAFRRYEVDEIELLCGDFFDLPASRTASVSALYDRASLIALPPPMRGRYAEHLSSLVHPGTKMLLITLEYAQDEMAGPPFSVTEPEVTELFRAAFDVTRLNALDVLGENPRFQERGLTRLGENTYLLERLAFPETGQCGALW